MDTNHSDTGCTGCSESEHPVYHGTQDGQIYMIPKMAKYRPNRAFVVVLDNVISQPRILSGTLFEYLWRERVGWGQICQMSVALRLTACCISMQAARCFLDLTSYRYCTYDRQEITAQRPCGAHARDSVNFRNFSPCIARARRARAGLTVYPPSRTFELLAFGE